MAVKLFVGSLAYGTTSERLREAFARYGVVQAATVMTDRETGRSRGFGFVEMATPEEAEQALAGLNNAALDGRTIRVDKATPRGAPGTGPSVRAVVTRHHHLAVAAATAVLPAWKTLVEVGALEVRRAAAPALLHAAAAGLLPRAALVLAPLAVAPSGATATRRTAPTASPAAGTPSAAVRTAGGGA